MTDEVRAPFSSREAGPHSWVVDDFPDTARNALLHLFQDLVSRKYVAGWIALAMEANRIARASPTTYSPNDDEDVQAARRVVEIRVHNMRWAKVIDLIEALHSSLAVDVKSWSSFHEDYDIETPVEEVRTYISERIQLLFLEESLALSFQDGVAFRKGRSHSSRMVAKAEVVLGDPRLRSSRIHYGKALQYFRKTDSPDYPNVVKEAVCAVEAAGKALFPDMKARNLGALIPKIRGIEDGQLPPSLAKTFDGLYGYRNSGEGVAHGASDGGKVCSCTAEYVLAVAAAQVILLVDLEAGRSEDIHF